jgi:hypothetical protein
VVCISKETTRDFTLDKYRELCHSLQINGYTPLTLRDYLNGKSADSSIHGKKIVILRHDVDRKILNALRMANLEHEIGIHSTYYFRYPYTFKPDIIREIQDLGHEIGYHYEVSSKAKGEYQKAIALFKSELEDFRKIFPVDTICAHGNVLSPHDNLDLWKQYDFRNYGLKGEAYLSVRDIDYFSDVGRDWNRISNISDFIGTDRPMEQPQTTDNLIGVIRKKGPPVLMLSIHPERWSHSTGSYLVNFGTDMMFNAGKVVIKSVRKFSRFQDRFL